MSCRDKVLVATKVAGPSAQMTWIRGGPMALDAGNIRAAIDGSLQRLRTDYIDLYQLHWPDRCEREDDDDDDDDDVVVVVVVVVVATGLLLGM
jgi:aryl-alcohol dehydrogenase-like predicted oxidoreductase